MSVPQQQENVVKSAAIKRVMEISIGPYVCVLPREHTWTDNACRRKGSGRDNSQHSAELAYSVYGTFAPVDATDKNLKIPEKSHRGI